MATKDLSSLIVNNILAYSHTRGDLLSKFNIDFFLAYFDRNAILEITDRIQPHKHLTVQDFVRLFLLQIQHTEEETLYLALSLKRLYEAILQRTSDATQTIQFSDFTNYLCEKISKEDLQVVIPPKRIGNDRSGREEMNLQPTIIISKVKQDIPKISKDVPKKNKKLQQKKGVSKFLYSKHLNRIIAVGSLSSSIYLYDNELSEKREITPRLYKQMQKEVSILSISYSTRNSRIGAILTNGMMIFWQGCDDFVTEKYISTRNCGDKIYYLEQLNEWITVDKSTLYFWDLKEESITHTLACRQSAYITDICQINHLKAICVSVVSVKQEKYLLIYHQCKKVARINLGNAGCHTLHYNKLTQSLIPLGYNSSVPVYTIEGIEFDTELKFVLRGHKSIITCIDSIEENTLMVTGDDIGEIRIWELAYMRCIQSIKLTKWLGGIKLVGNRLFYSDSRINLMQLDHFQIRNSQKCIPLYQFYDENQEYLWIITRKDARKTDIKKGKIVQIYTLCSEEDQISAAVHLGDGFVIGNSKGEIFRYDSDCNIKWDRQAHEGEVKALLYDHNNRLIFSLGHEGRIVAWPQRNTQIQEQRKTITFNKKSVSYIRISSRSNILIAGNNEEKELTIWDFEILKLYQVLAMQSEITAVFMSEIVDVIIIGTVDMKITFVKFIKKQHSLDLSIICVIDLLLVQQIYQFCRIQNDYLTQLILIPSNENTCFVLICSTIKGVVFTFDLTTTINHHFVIKDPAPHQSVNILRNQKEEFESSFSQRGRIQSIDKLVNNCKKGEGLDNIIWIKKITKQGTNCISKIAISDNVFGVLCQDYFKLINLTKGQIQASLNINQPFPIKWNFNHDNQSNLKKNVYQTLKILDNILKTTGYEMLAKQYKMINITNFMENIKKEAIPMPQKSALVKIPNQKANSSNEEQPEPTLKALQAYKRVKMIKKISQQSMYIPVICESLTKSQEHQIDKDQVSQFLYNKSYAESTSQGYKSVDRDLYLQNLSTKLSQSVFLSQNKKAKTVKPIDVHENKKHLMAKGSLKDESMIKQLSSSKKALIHLKQNSLLWQKHSQSKQIKQILQDLNSQLRSCRLKYNRVLQS